VEGACDAAKSIGNITIFRNYRQIMPILTLFIEQALEKLNGFLSFQKHLREAGPPHALHESQMARTFHLSSNRGGGH